MTLLLLYSFYEIYFVFQCDAYNRADYFLNLLEVLSLPKGNRCDGYFLRGMSVPAGCDRSPKSGGSCLIIEIKKDL